MCLPKTLFGAEEKRGTGNSVPYPEDEAVGEENAAVTGITGYYERNFTIHQNFMARQTRAHREFLESRARSIRSLMI